MKRLLSLTAVFIVLGISALGSAAEPARSTERVIIRTAAGDIVLALFPEIAPKHAEQFLRLVQSGAYNTTHIFRIEPGVLLQISPVQGRMEPIEERQKQLLKPLPDELSSLKHRRGTVSMALQNNQPNTGESSFFILLKDSPDLDLRYTIFGEVVSGMDVVDEIARFPVEQNFRPRGRMQIPRMEAVAGEKELSSLAIAPLQKLVHPGSGPAPKTDSAHRVLAGGLLGMLAWAILAFALSPRLPLRYHRAAYLMIVLTGAFTLYAVFTPWAWRAPILGGLLFLGSLGLFRLMSRFET